VRPALAAIALLLAAAPAIAQTSPSPSSPSTAPDTRRVVDRIAAVVNEAVITLSDIYDLGSREILETCEGDAQCTAEVEGQVLDVLIRQELMKQELVKLSYDITADEIDGLIQQTLVEHGYASREELRVAVEAEGFTWESYRSFLADRERVNRFQGLVLRNRVTISDDEVKDIYQRLVRDMDGPTVLRIAAFGYKLPKDATVEQRAAAAQELFDQLAAVRAGTLAWAAVAEKYDTAKVARLFENQTFGEGDLLPALSKAVFALDVKGVTDPVLVGDVIYGAVVIGREKGVVAAPPLEQVQDNLMEQLFAQKIEAAEDQWYTVARRTAAIKRLVGVDPNELPKDEATEASQPAPTGGTP
jgi:parvulin-like peptidyl-prolyl isomerase